MVVTTLAYPNSSRTNAPAFPQVSQKGFNILFGPIFQRFVLEKTIEILGPPHIEGRTVRSHPILLRSPLVEPRGQVRGTSDNAPLWGDIPAKSWCIHRWSRPSSSAAGIGFPKKIALFGGTADIHDFQHRNPLNVNKLVQNKALYNRRNYHHNIIFLSNICWEAINLNFFRTGAY